MMDVASTALTEVEKLALSLPESERASLVCTLSQSISEDWEIVDLELEDRRKQTEEDPSIMIAADEFRESVRRRREK